MNARALRAARTTRLHRARLKIIVALSSVVVLTGGVAWAYWSAGSVVGGNGASGATSVGQGATPTAIAAGNAVTVSWAATTLASGQAVSGYWITRYSGTTPQTITSACTGTIAATTCVESGLSAGAWTYTVIPVFGTYWLGAESTKSGTVIIGNQPPVAVANSYTVNEDGSLTVAAAGVLTNDTDSDGDPLTAVLASGVADGGLTFNSNGGFTYVPGVTFNGFDSFTYKANDGGRDSSPVTVTLTVTAVNDPPVNSVPATQQDPMNTNRVFSVANNNPISISDIDAGAATVRVRLTATQGTITLPVLTGLTFSVGDGTGDATMTFDGSIATINLRLDGATFIPTTNYTGSAAALEILTSDLGFTGTGGTLTDTDTVTINVNSLGIFTANQDIGVPPGTTGSTSYTSGTYTVAGSGADIWDTSDHFQYVYRSITGDGRLTAKVVSDVQTPTASGAAKASVMFRESVAVGSIHGMMNVMESSGSEFLWRLTTNGVSGASGTAGPVAPYWVRITRLGNVVTAERSANGSTWVLQGTQTTITMASTILVGLGVTAHDTTKLSTVTYDNVALTTPPAAVADGYSVNEDTTLNVAARGVLANDTDPQSDALTAVLVSGTTGLTLNANGSFAYVPPAGFSGTASFTYKANDAVFDSNTVTVNIVVNAANEVPSFTEGADQSVLQGSSAQTVAGWATAISQGTGESGQLVDFIVTNNNNALFSVQPAISAAGTLTYTPGGATGVATVSVRIHDNGGTANGATDTSAIQTFTITITATVPCGTQLLVNPGFESGAVTWTGTAGVVTNASLAVAARTGTWRALLGGNGTDVTETLSQTVTIPAGCSVSLTYWLQVTTAEGVGTAYDFFRVKVNGVAIGQTFSNLDSGVAYLQRTVDLSAYAGQTITLTFESDEDISLATNFWLDDVALTTATPTDSTGPTGGSVDASGLVGTGSRYATSTSLSLVLAKGTDPSGVATTGNTLLRATATLSNAVCGTFGTYTLITGGTDPASPKTDTVTDQACYSYRYVVLDTLGNSTTYTSPGIKVDLTAPAAPSLAYSVFTNTWWPGSGTTVYYRSAAASGSFTATGTATDAVSGIASYAFPALGTNWTSTPGALGVNVYSWSGAPAAPGTKNVTATNNAALTSANAPFTGTDDSTAPTAGTVTPPAVTQASTTISVAYTTGTDVGSGLGTRLLQRQFATLSGSTCGSYSGWATAATNPGSSPYSDVVTAGFCYQYQYVVSDNVGNLHTATSANVVKVTSGLSYTATVSGETSLLNYWRLGESTVSSDSFTGTTGTQLAAHTGETGATWTLWQAPAPRGVLTDAGRLRRDISGGVGYYASGVPPNANYTVEADIHVKTVAATDDIGINGRIDLADTNAIGTNYLLRYHIDGTVAEWQLRKNIVGVGTSLATYSQTLTPGVTYRIGLKMSGTTISMIIDGVERGSAVDSSISGAGRAGVRLGASSSTAPQSDTQGLHLDTFRVNPALTDSKGSNNGDYFSGPTLGGTGAIAGDANTAVQFDGINDCGVVARSIQDDFTVELWFKSTAGLGTNNTQWWQGQGLLDADAPGAANDFGISLGADGRVVAGVGKLSTGDVSVVSGTGFSNGAWHHVVFTRTKATGLMELYIDKISRGTATNNPNVSLNASTTMNLGKTQATGLLAGWLDEVAVYTSVLTPAQVTAHYDAAQ